MFNCNWSPSVGGALSVWSQEGTKPVPIQEDVIPIYITSPRLILTHTWDSSAVV